MATTVHHNPSSNQFIPVSSSTSAEFFLQNVSKTNTAVMVVWASAVPAADTIGHVLQPGDSLNRNSLTGTVYARGMTGDAVVAMTEEV